MTTTWRLRPSNVGFLAEETTDARVHENTRGWRFIGIREREFLAHKLARSMMVSVENIEISRPVSSYGVHSLLAV